MIATPQQSLEAAAELARSVGIEAHILSDELEGESREVARCMPPWPARWRGAAHPLPSLASSSAAARPRSPSSPKAAAAAVPASSCSAAPSRCRASLACTCWPADHDGIDGIEDNAGAIVTPDTLARALAAGMKAGEYLDRNDAYSFFHALGDLVVPGPTFTNVNDFRALLVC